MNENVFNEAHCQENLILLSEVSLSVNSDCALLFMDLLTFLK